MGIVILPFIFGALIIGIISLIKIIKLFRKNQIGLKEILLGFMTSLAIFGLICLSYIIEKRAYGLSHGFRIPIYMVYIPFVFHILTENGANSKLKYISKIFLASIVASVILGFVFNDLFNGLLDYLGIEKYY